MKYTLLILSSCVNFAIAQEIPSDYARLKELRKSKIEDIDQQYVKALKKLKDKYTKKANLKIALEIDKEIKDFEAKLNPKEEQKIATDADWFLGRWNSNQFNSYMTLYKKGDASYVWNNGRPSKGVWKLSGDELIIKWNSGNSYTFSKISKDDDMIRAIQTRGKLKEVTFKR